MGIGGVLHQLHVDMEASDLRQEDQIGGYEEVGALADVLRRQFAADFESSSFKLDTVSGSNLCPSKDDIEFDISFNFLNIHQQQGVFWLLDSQEFLHRKDLRCSSKHDLFAMFSLEGVKQKRRRFLCLLVLFCVCTDFAPTGCAPTWLPVLVSKTSAELATSNGRDFEVAVRYVRVWPYLYLVVASLLDLHRCVVIILLGAS